MVYIETPRLILRDWKEEDFVPFAEMNGNPSVMEFFLHPLSGEESRNRAEVRWSLCGFYGLS